MKLFSIMWSNYVPPLKEACATHGIELTAFSSKQLQRKPELLARVRSALVEADALLLYRTQDAFWDELEPDFTVAGTRQPVIVVGSDPSLWGCSSVSLEVASRAYSYLLYNGRENLELLARYLRQVVQGEPIDCPEPRPVAWEGLYHPGLDRLFDDTKRYLAAYRDFLPRRPEAWVGLLYSRSSWVNGNLEVERHLIAELEAQGLGVIPAFFYSIKDAAMGNQSGVEVVERFFLRDGTPMVQGIVKLSSFFLASGGGSVREGDALPGVALVKRLGIPLFNPVISYYKNREQWQADLQGLGSQVAWSVALPEFEGVIEPIVIGASRGAEDPGEERYEPIPERIAHFARRVSAWLALSRIPNSQKKIAFILHDNPCASAEASVGAGAHLDTLESVAQILNRMRAAGYDVTPPASGAQLIDDIMSRKAISEFRWTSTDEIVAKGGVLASLDLDHYRSWFEELPPATQARMAEAWGSPPGEEKEGIPAAMVHEGKILVTGVRYGNAVVCVQPKRGCAGARCDGQVCKILHDPEVPPPHQYVATYKWLAREFGAQAMVHVGTHGNLEFLPGKSTGLSAGCFPDIGIDTMPHLYVYNADNPPEGTVAKRRTNAVLVDHLQPPIVPGALYGDLEALERLLEDHQKFKAAEPGKAHTITHLIASKAKGLQLVAGELTHEDVESRLGELHDLLSTLKGTRIPKGMHVFGRIPEGEGLSELVYAIVRYDAAPDSLRGLVSQAMGVALEAASDATVRDRVDAQARAICKAFLEEQVSIEASLQRLPHGPALDRGRVLRVEMFIDDVRRRVQASDEMGALLRGFEGGFIEPGPAGLVTRGRHDVLPTGRNFYALDPEKIPSPVAWATGRKLADKTLEKYLKDEGAYPENVAFYWQCTDIMWADGEGLAQMMALLGVRPVWQPNGRVRRFEVLPLAELGRPRIDITVRVSGITRDNFPSAIDLLDEAVQAVAALKEPSEQNFVRKHTLERLGARPEGDREALRRANYRIFASAPGTYQAGTQLAVYASAWKTEKDLSDVFLYWNGYAYGKGVFGEQAHADLRESLRTVKLSFNKTVSDEYDLTGCCGYFGTHGGMINAARIVSGGEIKNYYGDTREQGGVEIRTLEEELRRVARGKILNPVWIEGMKEHGYKGAGEISKRVGRLYGWQATSKAVDGAIFDDVARTFLVDDDNRAFFEQENPWALEELTRRLMEAAQRGLWQPAEDVRDQLQERYLEVEGWIEERMGDVEGEFQGGSIDIMGAGDVSAWQEKMKEALK